MQIEGRRVEWHATIDSTMIAASRLAAEGAPSGTVVGADEQTAGRGRQGHAWHSESKAGLYVSVILRYAFTPETVPLVTMAIGLATVDAILKSANIVADLRWPNDVLIGDRKCAGILTQLEGAAIISGIGINVNHTALPPDLAPIATSLRLASGRTQSREALLEALLPAIESYCELLATQGKHPILDAFTQASSYVQGRRVQVDELTGTTAGLNESGFLLLRDDRGKTHTIVAGGVRPV
jgi:BirA family biotin operon repressor/biotin-[acetyl-CoA-carboxylase] ligase